MKSIDPQDTMNNQASKDIRCEEIISRTACHVGENFRYVMVIEYLGSSFAGSQIQPGQKTVQSEIEKALKILTGTDVKTIFAGRTDKGVNAKGQVVHFDVPFMVNTYRLIYAMNSILPSEISIASLNQTEKDFHSQRSARYRWYRYTINNGQQRSIWLSNALHVRYTLDIEQMNKALSYITGKHDFTSFKNTDSLNPAIDCTIYRALCTFDAEDARIINIDLIADRFLYNMVRIIVGTLIDIGKGSFPPEHMLKVLEAKDRTKAGPTVKPEGLVLMTVGYSKYNINDNLNKEAIQNENILCKAS